MGSSTDCHSLSPINAKSTCRREWYDVAKGEFIMVTIECRHCRIKPDESNACPKCGSKWDGEMFIKMERDARAAVPLKDRGTDFVLYDDKSIKIHR